MKQERRTEVMKPPGLKEIQAILRERRGELARDYGVAEIGVFGSCVREEAAEASDIDILVEFNRPIGFFKFLELEERLGEWLGSRVDLVTKAALKPRIGRRILGEVAML
ncbi:MAG: nucleotidyltransferase family protein [Thermodesulfobacteriota bacterium]